MLEAPVAAAVVDSMEEAVAGAAGVMERTAAADNSAAVVDIVAVDIAGLVVAEAEVAGTQLADRLVVWQCRL